jgi:hypothetical protein
MKFEKVKYEDLNAKAKERYNFQKVSAKLADYGFTTIWLSNDWQGADFIAVHADGVTDLKIQLKGRLSFDRRYRGKNIYVCFINEGTTYLYPHDEVLDKVESKISDRGWIERGAWTAGTFTNEFRQLLEPYLLK